MIIEMPESELESGFWARSKSRYPVPMSRHLWDLLTPAFLE